MARYIDADKALVMIRHSKEDKPAYADWDNAHDCCIDCVNSTPTADVVEVVHGVWVEGAEHFTNGFYEAECNKCGTYISWNRGNSGEWNFCPNCGAKMDGERKDNG